MSSFNCSFYNRHYESRGWRVLTESARFKQIKLQSAAVVPPPLIFKGGEGRGRIPFFPQLTQLPDFAVPGEGAQFAVLDLCGRELDSCLRGQPASSCVFPSCGNRSCPCQGSPSEPSLDAPRKTHTFGFPQARLGLILIIPEGSGPRPTSCLGGPHSRSELPTPALTDISTRKCSNQHGC